jgi:hypothetical protein
MALKKYTAVAEMVTYCTVEVEAENADEAFAIARSMCGGEYQATEDGAWHVIEVNEVKHD